MTTELKKFTKAELVARVTSVQKDLRGEKDRVSNLRASLDRAASQNESHEKRIKGMLAASDMLVKMQVEDTTRLRYWRRAFLLTFAALCGTLAAMAVFVFYYLGA